MKYNDKSRAFASFSGICPYGCLHCYTFSDDFINRGKATTEDIINDLKNKEFNIVYISGFRENFTNPLLGIALIEAIYSHFHCDILLTTRAVFDASETQRLFEINNRMRQDNKRLYFCESIPAYQSYQLLEPNPNIPSPQRRLEFIKQLYIGGISTILTIRPLCPDKFIPISESVRIINEIKGYCSAIISSGIVVNDIILKRLHSFPTYFNFTEKKIMSCLNNDITVKYVDVSAELQVIENLCSYHNIPFFHNSLPAINYIYSTLM